MKGNIKRNFVVGIFLVMLVIMSGCAQTNMKDTNKSMSEIAHDDTDSTSGTSISENSSEAGDTEDVFSEENTGERVLNKVTENYFEEVKLSREQTRAKNKDRLTQLANNENATDEQKEEAMKEIMNMVNIIEKETATENTLVAKGFNEAIVTILDDSVEVIINSQELTEQHISQIEDIVKRKTECQENRIVISYVSSK